MNMSEQSYLSMPAFTGGKNTIRQFKNGGSQSFQEQARAVMKNLGVSVAAGMLRNKGYSVEACVFILLGK